MVPRLHHPSPPGRERDPFLSLSAIELVCIVDDDPFVRAATSSLVRSFGWEARAFESAVDFLASDAPGRTRCLVCDIQMPAMDGIDLLERLQREGLRIPTLFISAFATARTRERLQASPALCLIEKPIDAAELEAWIGRALALG
jgi:FixJ family two-component response regulator